MNAVTEIVSSDDTLTEHSIVWLEDIARLPYVRTAYVFTNTRTGPPRKSYGGRRVVGYATLNKCVSRDHYHFDRRVFLIDDHDRSEDPEGVYSYGTPVEAVDPMTVKPNVKGEQTERSWGGPFPEWFIHRL